MADDSPLVAALAVIQARGAIGERSLDDAIAHADRFVDLVPEGPLSLVDLGSGGGLPALVIAWRRPDVWVTMVERRANPRRSAPASGDLVGHGRAMRGARRRRRPWSATRQPTPSTWSRRELRGRRDNVPLCGRTAATRSGVALVSEPPTDRTECGRRCCTTIRTSLTTGIHQGIRRHRTLVTFHVKHQRRHGEDAPEPFHVKHSTATASPSSAMFPATMQCRRPDVDPREQEFFLDDRN